MKRNEIDVRFLEITASISLRVLRQILEAAILRAFAHPNFWAEQLHFFQATTHAGVHEIHTTFTVADIADDHGFLSPKLTDDQIKALLLPLLAEMLAEQTRDLIERELWLRSVHVTRVNRNLINSPAVEKYGRWLNALRDKHA